MTPAEASKKENQGIVYFNLGRDMESSSSKPKFKVGDKVRISKCKREVFDKGYTVDGDQYTNPVTYKLKTSTMMKLLAVFINWSS